MKFDKKLEIIESLKEDELREKVLIPLFTKMGFIDPVLHHHNNEKGKDIILKEYDSKFRKTLFLAVVVKAGDVNGSASGNSSYFALINQVKQALNEPYRHVYEIKEVLIDQVIIVISGKFLPTALDSIYGTLKQERLDKAIREPIDINKLISLIDEHFTEYWGEFENEPESLVQQRNNLLNNLSKLSKILFPDSKEQEKFLNTVVKSEFDINLLPYKTLTRYVANIGYKNINIDEIEEFYTDATISNYYCDIKKYFFEIKEKAQKVLYDFDEVIEILKAILNEKDPIKLVELTEELNGFVSSYGNKGFHFSTHDVEYQEEFGYALKEYKNKKNLLIETNVYDFYQKLHSEVSNRTLPELISFYKEHSKDEKDIWLGLKIEFDLNQMELKSIDFYKYRETPKIIEKDNGFGSTRKEIERFTLEAKNTIKIEIALNNYGFWKEEELTSEKKAKSFLWHYENGFEKKFLELIGYETE